MRDAGLDGGYEIVGISAVVGVDNVIFYLKTGSVNNRNFNLTSLSPTTCRLQMLLVSSPHGGHLKL
jgi:hypothetical protein